MVVLGQQGNFVRDLKRGKQAEEFILNSFKDKGFEGLFNRAKDKRNLSKWDIFVMKDDKAFYLEVKNDIMSKKTGNIGFEIGQGASHKPSCLLSTQSDYWVHIFYTEDNVYVSLCETSRLRQFILTKHLYNREDITLRFIQNCGDNNADLIVIPIQEFIDKFEPKLIVLTNEEAKERGLL